MKRVVSLLLAVMLLIFSAATLAEYKIYMTEESTEAIKEYKTLKKGSNGYIVFEMQDRLAYLGYMDYSEADGVYGNRTKDAVYAFQTANFLTGSDGTAYAYTLYKLYDDTAIPAWGIDMYGLEPGDSGLEVLRLEKRLCDTGYLADEYVDGYYSDGTIDAVFDFQLNNCTECLDGIACTDTLQLLYSYDMQSASR